MEGFNAILPLLSVFIGSGITYWLNVRTRRRSKVEEVFHEAIAAVAVAGSTSGYITRIEPWEGATTEEHRAFTSELGMEAHRAYVRAVADARAAVARASAYEASLRVYLDVSPAEFSSRADEIVTALRRCLD